MFIPDSRNVGGKNLILQSMYNHQHQLDEIISSPVLIKNYSSIIYFLSGSPRRSPKY